MDNIDNIKKNNTKFIIFEIIVIMLGIIGVTFAVSYVMDSINVNVDTAQLAVDYTGSLTLPTANLMPITDDSVDTNNENVMRINFTVKGASSNPDITIIYDVILSDLQIDSELKSEYLKWELEKNGVVISSGSFSPWFDSMKDGKLWLTEIQQDLPNNSSTPDSYEFRIWISESCPGDISTCTEDMDQSNMLNKSISGKIETVLYTKGKEALIREVGMNASEYIESLLVKNPETMNNDDPDGNVRYMGADPNNYVSFNNELWRIIGVFDVKSSENGQLEKRLKIIRNERIGTMSWDNKPLGTGSSTSEYGSNDWTDSALMEVLNNGAYWNRTSGTCPSGQNGATKSCDFSATGLTEEAKSLIGDAVWNLGGTASYTSASNGLASHFYGYERGTTVYSGRPTYWIGKIGLMYPSDYGYATSGGTTTNRASCLAKELFRWSSSSYSDCKNNDYLYNSSLYQWTLTPISSYSYRVFDVGTTGLVNINGASSSRNSASPVLYLKSTVEITGGDGTSGNPFTLS